MFCFSSIQHEVIESQRRNPEFCSRGLWEQSSEFLTSSNVSLCLINSSNPKYKQLSIMYDTQKHQIFTFQKLKPLNIFAISLKKLTKTCRFLSGPQRRTTKKRKSLHILYFTAGFQLYSHLYLYLCKNNSSNNTSSQPKLEFSVYWQSSLTAAETNGWTPPKKTHTWQPSTCTFYMFPARPAILKLPSHAAWS